MSLTREDKEWVGQSIELWLGRFAQEFPVRCPVNERLLSIEKARKGMMKWAVVGLVVGSAAGSGLLEAVKVLAKYI